MYRVSDNSPSNWIQKNNIQIAVATVLVGALLSGLGSYLAHRFGSLSLGATAGIATGGMAVTLLIALAILSSKKNIDNPSSKDPVTGTAAPPVARAAAANRADTTNEYMDKARDAAETREGKRFDPRIHRVAFICPTGEEASQVAYALFRHAYPTMELLPPHGAQNGFDPKNLLSQPRCIAPNERFFAALGIQPVKKLGEEILGSHPVHALDTNEGDQKMKRAMQRFYDGQHDDKTTIYITLGDEALQKSVKKRVGNSLQTILCPPFNPTGSYEEIADQIIDAIATGRFFG